MLGLLPMALSKGIGSEVQKPLAVVIIGGLVSATLLTLIVLSTLYLYFGGQADCDFPEDLKKLGNAARGSGFEKA